MAANAFTLFGTLDVDTRRFHSSLSDAEKRLEGVANKLTAFENRTAKAGQAADSASKQTDRLNASLGRAEKAARTKTRAIGDLGKSLSSAGASMKGFGTDMTYLVTVPLAAAGAYAFNAATKFDALRNKLTAATGSVAQANEKLEYFMQLARTSPGVFADGAAKLYAALKPMNVGDNVIEQVIKAFGRLKTAEENFDFDQFRLNMQQMFGQKFEMQDMKQALTFFPRFAELLSKQFGLLTTDLDSLQKHLQKLQKQGKLTFDGFAEAIANAVNQDENFGKLTETLGNKFQKMFAEIEFAVAPLGEKIAAKLEPALQAIVGYVQDLVNWFNQLTPEMQDFVLGTGAAVAALGIFAAILGSLVQVIGFVLAGLAPLGKAIAWIAGILSFKLLAIMAVVAGVVWVAYKAWQMGWVGIQNLVIKAINAIRLALSDFFVWVTTPLKGLANALSYLPGSLGNMGRKMESNLVDIKNSIGRQIPLISTTAKEFGDAVPTNISKGIKDGQAETVESAGLMTDAVKKAIESGLIDANDVVKARLVELQAALNRLANLKSFSPELRAKFRAEAAALGNELREGLTQAQYMGVRAAESLIAALEAALQDKKIGGKLEPEIRAAIDQLRKTIQQQREGVQNDFFTTLGINKATEEKIIGSWQRLQQLQPTGWGWFTGNTGIDLKQIMGDVKTLQRAGITEQDFGKIGKTIQDRQALNRANQEAIATGQALVNSLGRQTTATNNLSTATGSKAEKVREAVRELQRLNLEIATYGLETRVATHDIEVQLGVLKDYTETEKKARREKLAQLDLLDEQKQKLADLDEAFKNTAKSVTDFYGKLESAAMEREGLKPTFLDAANKAIDEAAQKGAAIDAVTAYIMRLSAAIEDQAQAAKDAAEKNKQWADELERFVTINDQLTKMQELERVFAAAAAAGVVYTEAQKKAAIDAVTLYEATNRVQNALSELGITLPALKSPLQQMQALFADTTGLQALADKLGITVEKLKQLIIEAHNAKGAVRDMLTLDGMDVREASPMEQIIGGIKAKFEEFQKSTPTYTEGLANAFGTAINEIGNIFGDAVLNWDGTLKGFFKSVAQGFRQLLARIVADLMSMIIKNQIINLLSSLGLGSLFGVGGSFPGGASGGAGPGFEGAAGGLIRGPGTGTSDSISALVSNGEYIIPAKAVRKYGSGFFDALRTMQYKPAQGYAQGGVVGSGSSAEAASNTSNVFNINVTGNDSPQQTAMMIQREVLSALKKNERRNR